MEKLKKRIRLVSVVLLCVGLLLCASTSFAAEEVHKPTTIALMNLIQENPQLGKMLETSIAKAKMINPDPITNPVQSLMKYYDFIDEGVELIPRQVLENPTSLIRDQILQTICYFYFLIDQPLEELENKELFKNALQYYPIFSKWINQYVNAWGKFLETEASWSEEVYQGFYDDPRFGLKNNWYEPSSNWTTFNRFFSRYLRSKAMRPIAVAEDTSVVVAPADSVPQGVWPIDKDSNIEVKDGLKVKLATYYNVGDLLSEDSQYKDAFANGVLTHTFLNVNDYHRYHFAVGGEIKEKRNIQKNVALEVSWNPQEHKYDPIDSTGWQFTQTRGYVILDTKEYGLVALIPMGMAQVSSVNFEGNVQEGITHEKGDMLGTFLFGGSDFVMLFQEQAGFEMTTEADKHLLMGEEYGVMKKK